MNDGTTNLIEVIISGIQLLIILGSALWAYFRFRKEDPFHPRIEFDLNCKFFGPQNRSYLTSFIISAKNHGNVEHRFSEIRLRVLGINANEPLSEFEGYSPMIKFPESIIKGINLVPEKFGYYFVRPGVNQLFHYASQVPDRIKFIIIRATFKYQATNDIHIAEKVFEVRAE